MSFVNFYRTVDLDSWSMITIKLVGDSRWRLDSCETTLSRGRTRKERSIGALTSEVVVFEVILCVIVWQTTVR